MRNSIFQYVKTFPFLAASAIAVNAHADLIDRAGLVKLIDFGNGTARSEVLLPCGQSLVTAVVRKNSNQLISTNIAGSAKPLAGGFCLYSVALSGLVSADTITARFESALPGKPVVLTPGPGNQDWSTVVYGINSVSTSKGVLKVVDLANGSLRFELVAPSGQNYAEVFSRNNAILNVAGNIVATEKPIGNGYSLYSKTVSGYSAGNFVEYRSYEYLPAAPGVFTPGPSANQWQTYNYGSAPGDFFVTTDATFNLAPVTSGGTTSEYEVYYAQATSSILPQSSGWALLRGGLPALTVPLFYNTALLGNTYIRHCVTGAWIPLSSVPEFAPSGGSYVVSGGLFQYKPTTNSFLPGTQPDPNYECGGTPMTVQTITGPVTLMAGAKIQYAYAVFHRKL